MPIRALKAKKAEHLKAAGALNAIADRELTAEEQTTLDGHIDAIKQLNAQIDRAEFLANQEAGLTAGGVAIPDRAVITVTDNLANDPKRGFRSFGEFAGAVAQARMHGVVDQRLHMNAAAPGTVSNEGVGAEGGFAVPPEFSRSIWNLSLGEESLVPMTDNTEVSGNSMIFPKDETTPWGGSGVQAYWQSEAQAGTASKIALGTETLVLQKLMVMVPVTNELLSDAVAMGSYLGSKAPSRITWKTNEAILFGDGVGKPLGALSASNASLITVSKESGQAASTLDAKNFSKMVSRLLVDEFRNAVWIMQPDVLPILESVTLSNYPIYLPSNNISGSSFGMLKGRPVMLSEHAAALNSAGDINLLSLKGYRTITKAGGIETATSMHLYFDADATAFRFTYRINGKPILSAPVTPPKSSNTRSHFVTLQAR